MGYCPVAQSHRNLRIPNTTDKSPASVPLRHISNLLDVLMGQCRWDDPLAQQGASIVLGDSDEEAWQYVENRRQRTTKRHKRNMAVIRNLEKAHYGRSSYFRLVESQLYRKPRYGGDHSGTALWRD